MKITESKTRIFKSHNGWEGSTVTTVGKKTYQISTIKGFSGKLSSTAQPCEVNQGDVFQSIKITDMFTGNVPLISEKVRATEKAVKKQHSLAVMLFDHKAANGEIKGLDINPEPEIGTIIFMDGYGKGQGSEGNKHVVYEIQDGEFFTSFNTVELDTLALNSFDKPRPIQEKLGIGNYYKFDYKFEGSQDDITNLLIEAQAKKKITDAQKKEEGKIEEESKVKHLRYLEQFKTADVRKTTSIIKKEIKKRFPSVQKVSVKTSFFSGGSSLDVNYFSEKKIQELEDFIRSFQHGNFNSNEDIYEYSSKEIILQGYILKTYKYCHARFEEKE